MFIEFIGFIGLNYRANRVYRAQGQDYLIWGEVG